MSRPPEKGRTRRRKPATQVAALCIAPDLERVLLITSRGTGRWIVPKGWPMQGRSLPRTALEEAWEEAGVEGSVGKTELGRYHYEKLRDHGFAIPVEVRLYPVAVTRLASQFPEAGQRRLQWFAPGEAARQVAEPALGQLIADLPRHAEAGLIPGVRRS